MTYEDLINISYCKSMIETTSQLLAVLPIIIGEGSLCMPQDYNAGDVAADHKTALEGVDENGDAVPFSLISVLLAKQKYVCD